MDSSDFLKKQEEDKDIKLFKEAHPDVYKFIVRLIDGQCDDKGIENFIDEYGEYVYDYIKKIVDGELDDEEVRRLKEEYPEEIYIAIQKIVERKKVRLTEAKPQRTPYRKGDFIGQKYEVYDVLGEGGFGIVYLVYSHETKEVYALKTFRDEYLEDIKTRERFRKEAQVWIDLERHPYLVRAYFVDEISGRLYISIEHIAPDEQGLNNLDGYLRRRPPDLAQSLKWAIQFCHGMEYAYLRGIKAHRDIKPANILIGQDKTIKISDFGLAGVIGESKAISGVKLGIQKGKIGFSCQTMEGTGFGTPTHMPPEQFINASGCDERSDIYSFGVVLYQMATGGKLPFLAPLPKDDSYEESRRFWIEMYRLHSKASIPKLSSPLFPTIQKCLEKEPKRRYQSLKKLRSDLEPILKVQTGEVIKLPETEKLTTDEWINKGFSLAILDKYREAIACYEKAIEMDSKDSMAWNNKGGALGRMGKLEESLACYNKALDISPEFSMAWGNKGAALADLSKYQEAITCYDRALEINPNDETVWNNKGNALTKLNKPMDAIACYDQALEINPRYAMAWNNKGGSLENLGKHQEAIACYDQALEINSRYAIAWNNKGRALGSIGKLEESLACYNKALNISPEDSLAWNGKGVALEKLEKQQEALACYDRAIKINPENATAWRNKGNLHKELGNIQEALVCYNKALEIDPKSDDAWNNKGNALKDIGKHNEAITCYDEALKINPTNAAAWYNKAIAEYQLGKRQNAILSYRRFIELAPARYAEQVETARRRLRELEKKSFLQHWNIFRRKR